MKKVILSLCMTACIAAITNAQTNTFPTTGSAGIGTISPNGSSILEMQSTTKGMLAPRMTLAQRNAIASPVNGLLIYQTNNTAGFYYYNGSAWVALAPKSANKTLSNLDTTSINLSLLPAANNTIDLGSSALNWNEVYVNNIKFMDGTTLSTAAGGAETDPQVGTNTTSFIPRWNGSALVTGLIQDNGSKIGINKAPDIEHRFTVLRQATSGLSTTIYSAIRGESNTAGSSTINSVGYLGVNNPSGMYPIVFPSLSFDDIGVLGIKRSSSTGEGAGIYGWSQGGTTSNYGVFGASTASSQNNYGVYGKTVATNSALNYAVYGETQGAVGNYGVYGKVTTASNQFGYAVFGSASGAGTNYAGFFSGHTYVGADNEALTISGTNPYIQFKDGATENAYLRASGSDLLLATNSGNASGKVVLRTNGVGRLWVDAVGNVSIGSSGKVASGYMLSVVGKVMAEEVRVELNGTWPDYVFAKDYKLMPLQTLKKYVSENNHLPEVPAAEEMKGGIEVGKMNKMLMQKVEELTLYVIQLNEEIQQLKNQNK
jgi:trimeric autotransporter adhesin